MMLSDKRNTLNLKKRECGKGNILQYNVFLETAIDARTVRHGKTTIKAVLVHSCSEHYEYSPDF